MQRIILLIAIISLLLSCQFKAAQTDLPNLNLIQSNGNNIVAFSLFDGRPLLVNLWATWCAPCVKELPELVKFKQNNPNWKILLVNQGEDPSKVRLFLQQHNISDNIVYFDQNSDWYKAVGGKSFPTSVVYNTKAKLVDSYHKALSKEQLVQLSTQY